MIDAMKQRGRCQLIVLLVFVFFISVIILVVGIMTFTGKKDHSPETPKPLLAFMKNVKKQYFHLYPHDVIYDPEVRRKDLFELFQPYDPSPSAMKRRTDEALNLRKSFDTLEIDHAKLEPRERKCVAQIKHYLDSTFGNPFGENYYAGDWMMGPNYYCYQLICNIGTNMKHTFNLEFGLFPESISDVEKIMAALKRTKLAFERYEANMMLGVRAGMVRAVEDCKASRNAFRTHFKMIAAEGGKGVLKEKFAKALIDSVYYDKLPLHMSGEFEDRYGMKIEEKMADILVNYVGNPVESFMNFLKANYSRHCIPSNVVSGLSKLPLKYVWLDQKQTAEKTTGTLPSGEKLSGKRTYEMILPYFLTTKSYTPEKIKRLGETQLTSLYAYAVDLAMKITGKNKTEALKDFVQDLDDSKHFFNKSVIPDNENDEEGARKCTNMVSAKLHCPVRYEAMMSWFQFVEMVLAKIEPKTVNLFHMTGKYVTTPNCPIEMRANFNPSVGSQSFDAAGKLCERPGYYNLPFFMQRPGPIFNAFSVAGHEARPGHSTQVQGFYEHFSTRGKGDIIDWLNMMTSYTVFIEGWALYAENPLLARDTDLYKDNLLQEYGMLKWQLWRALRLIIDSGLHVRGMSMQQGKDYFEKYCWDSTDKAHKDVIRYMSVPGQATAYMIGQLEIWKMRNATEMRLKENNIKFDLKEFHFQILSQGSSPIEYLWDHVDDYIECKINLKARPHCHAILDPSLTNQKRKNAIGTESRWNFIRNIMQPPRYLE